MPEITQGNQPALPYLGPGRRRQVIKTRSGGAVMMFPALRLRRDVVCQQAVELVTGYLEGTLARAPSRGFQAHLVGCPQCTEYLAQMRKTIELIRSLTPHDLTRRCRTSSPRSTGNRALASTASQLTREPGGAGGWTGRHREQSW